MNKSDRERQIPYDIAYTWNLKYGTNELIYKTETNTTVSLTSMYFNRFVSTSVQI